MASLRLSSSISPLARVRTRSGLAWLLGVVVFAGACAGNRPPPPAPALRQAARMPEPEDQPKTKAHEAPPPDYGNRVVLSPLFEPCSELPLDFEAFLASDCFGMRQAGYVEAFFPWDSALARELSVEAEPDGVPASDDPERRASGG